jgi:hypothetical protein
MGAVRKLYDIVADVRDVLEVVADAGGELTDAQAEQLDKLGDERARKIEAYAKVITDLDDEEARFKARAKRAASQRDWLKNALLFALLPTPPAEGEPLPKVKGDVYTVAVQRNPPSVEIVEVAQIPAEYMVPPPPTPPPTVNKYLVLEDLKLGKAVPGAKLAEPRYHVRIR